MPDVDERVRNGSLRSIVVEDRSGAVSRVHAEVRVDGWDVMLVDSRSRNGTHIAGPGANSVDDRAARPVPPAHPGHPRPPRQPDVPLRVAVGRAVGGYRIAGIRASTCWRSSSSSDACRPHPHDRRRRRGAARCAHVRRPARAPRAPRGPGVGPRDSSAAARPQLAQRLHGRRRPPPGAAVGSPVTPTAIGASRCSASRPASRAAARPAPVPSNRTCTAADAACGERGPHHHERGLADVGQVDDLAGLRRLRHHDDVGPHVARERRDVAHRARREPRDDPAAQPLVRRRRQPPQFLARVRDRQQVRAEAAGQLQGHARRRQQPRQHDPRGPLRAHQRRRELGQPPPGPVVGAFGHGDQHPERVGRHPARPAPPRRCRGPRSAPGRPAAAAARS